MHRSASKRWWRMDGSGNCYLILRYGNKAIAPTADKGAIAVGDKGKLVTVLDAVIAAVKRKAAQPHYAHKAFHAKASPLP
jgi:hypothetical protein